MPPSFDAGSTLADRMRAHARKDRHLYAELMRAMADDWERGGPVRRICAGWEDAPEGAVVQLRLLAGLFRIVLTGRAPELVPFYPCLGGTAPPEAAWPAVRAVLKAHEGELHDALDTAPQTNEVGRSTALLVGLFEAVRRSGLRRVRLLEPGASAGLNLLVDRFRFVTETWTFGPVTSALTLRGGVVGVVEPERFIVVDRRGCDLAPVDPSTPQGQLRLRSFVWPFDLERHERLTAALSVASEHSVVVDEAPAGEWLERQLSVPTPEGTLTVVWQSVTALYWPAAERERVDGAIDAARRNRLVAHIAMEHTPGNERGGAMLTLTGLPGRDDVMTLARVHDHGRPVTLLPQRAARD
jgi:hypothetical protein